MKLRLKSINKENKLCILQDTSRAEFTRCTDTDYALLTGYLKNELNFNGTISTSCNLFLIGGFKTTEELETFISKFQNTVVINTIPKKKWTKFWRDFLEKN